MEGGKAVGPISEVEWVVVNSISDDFSESNSSSSSSTDMVDDDVSSSFGPLYELSQLMAQLPIKRGLSKYYEGKSRSFGRLGSVMSLQDVAKEGKRMKSSNNSGNYLCLRMLKRSKDGSVARSGLFLSASCGNGEDIEELIGRMFIDFEEERMSILEQLKMLEEKLISMDDEDAKEFVDVRPMDNLYRENGDHTEENSCLDGNITEHANGLFSEMNGKLIITAKGLLPLFDALSDENGDVMINGHEIGFHSNGVDEENKKLDVMKVGLKMGGLFWVGI
ncbi:hypothetical protein KY290_026635 [Solanum tuberosum]|uniref:Uncharacterized protein n=1 Tax=Solanum tuberosum TaxID=4113 RepID=A0ABQ7UX12_SOLTU|nr:hypothetical protein KY284_023710 [Solanum tuberosum]KAH0756365.1 hypothetical protein KY290_026635 [Solanum tuberosum]